MKTSSLRSDEFGRTQLSEGPVTAASDVVVDYGRYCRPGLARLLHALSLDAVYERAEGDRLWQRRGDELVEILDLVGGFGANLFGHYHPELVAEDIRLVNAKVPFLAQGSCRSGAAQLAKSLCKRIGDYVVIFTNSGTETVEAALKHILLERGKAKCWALQGAFHGKTLGAIQMTHAYRHPYGLWGPAVRFLDFEEPSTWKAAEREVADVAAIFVEPILGEGGVKPLPPTFVRWINKLQSEHGIPIVADEVQTGLGRTGTFLASTAIGLDPDYVCLSKCLGGGMAKIGALLIRRDRFIEDFSVRHTSTFAEDDRSCLLSMKALEILDRDNLPARCLESGKYLCDRLEETRELYPDVIKEVRGKGLMVGVELQDLSDSPSNTLRMLSRQDFLGYLGAAYLLNVHRIRIAPTLSQPFTLRVEPSAYITRADLDHFVGSMGTLCAALRATDIPHLTGFQIGVPSGPIVDYRPKHHFQHQRPRTKRRVGFIGHLLEPADAMHWDPSLEGLRRHDLQEYMARPSRVLKGVVFDQMNVRSRIGDEVHLSYIGLDLTPHQIVDAMKRRDTDWIMEKVENAVALARDEGCQVVGLGGYTSIVSGNCRRVQTRGIALTSGNSLTVGMGIEALKCAALQKGIDLSQSTLAVLGATGNIGMTYAMMMASEVRELVLVVRDGRSPRLKEVVKAVEGIARKLKVTDDLRDLRVCSVIAAASNTPEAMIHAEHLSSDQVVICDISLPSDVANDVSTDRPNAVVIHGGIVRLPENDDFIIGGMDLEPGHVYACLAETLLMGLEETTQHGSFGPVTQEGVEKTLALAHKHGFTLGKIDIERVSAIQAAAVR